MTQVLMTDQLTETELEAANSVIVGRGFSPVDEPCTLYDLMASLGWLDAGYWAEMLHLVADAIERERGQ